MKNIFICKSATLGELKEELKRTANHQTGYEPEAYRVAATKKVSLTEWNALTNGLLEDRNWIKAFNQRLANKPNTDWSKRNCIKVTCEDQHESLLIDPQGYDYARYVAILEN